MTPQQFSASVAPMPHSDPRRSDDASLRASCRVSSGSLPPRVRGGSSCGSVRVTIDEVFYYPNSREHSTRRPPATLDAGTTIVTLRWWGEQGEAAVWRPEPARMEDDGRVTRVKPTANPKSKPSAPHTAADIESAEIGRSHTVSFPVVVSPTTFNRYLNDAQWLGQRQTPEGGEASQTRMHTI